jgi:hypothetical protein
MISLTWPQVIGRRLARNFLLEPAPAGRLVDVVAGTCGIQAQVPAAAELGISARVAGITRQDVRDALWEKHTLVRTSGPRETKHILPANELPLWMAAMRASLPLRPVRDRRPSMSLAEHVALLHALKEALDGVVLTREELATKIAKRGGSRVYEPLLSPWGELLDRAFYEGVLVHGPDEGSKTTFARADQWTGSWEELDPGESITEVCRRYTSTYGPVTHQDFARWFWIEPNAARDIFDSIKAELEEVKIERRRAWILGSDAESSWEPVEGSLRLVPQYDCYVLGSYPRPPIVPDAFKAFLRTLHRATYEGAVGFSLLLIDGVVSGIWQRHQRSKRVDVTVSPIVTLTVRQHNQLNDEAARIAAFLGTDLALSVGPPE